jgi:hypothetical protein
MLVGGARAGGHGIVLGECPAAFPDPLSRAGEPSDRKAAGIRTDIPPANDPRSPLGKVRLDELFVGVHELANR